MKIYNGIAFCWLILVASGTQGQPYIDLIHANVSTSPGKLSSNPGVPRTFSHYRISVNAPKIIGTDSNVLLFNPIWEERFIQGNNTENYHVRGAIFWLTYTQNFGSSWSMTIGGVPRWNGEKSIQFSDGFQMGGAGLLSWKYRTNLKFQLGLYYNKEFFGNFFMPLAGIHWKIDKHTNLFGVLPSYLTFEKFLSKKLVVGAKFRTFTNSYLLKSDTLSRSRDYLRVQDNQLGVYMDWYVFPKWAFNLEFGRTIMRKINLGRSGYEDELISDQDNFYLHASLQYRLRFK